MGQVIFDTRRTNDNDVLQTKAIDCFLARSVKFTARNPAVTLPH